jgi:formylmethanofuran dehydrogenase subunit E
MEINMGKNKKSLEAIRDALFKEDGTINMEKEWDEETIEEVAEIVREHFHMETVECKFCGNEIIVADAHLHDGEFVGECCWDERLRATE